MAKPFNRRWHDDGIMTEFVFPPIPTRQFDWAAFRDPEGKIGWGETEQAAKDMLREMEE